MSLYLLNNPVAREARFLGKNGVLPSTPIIFAMVVVDQVAASKGYDRVVVTSITEGKHSKGSLHPWGFAFDFDVVVDGQGISDQDGTDLILAIRGRLNSEFDVIWEAGQRSHGHVEFDV